MCTNKIENKTLVVIDDDAIIWVLIKDMLQELGWVDNLKTFSDGLEALRYLQHAPIADFPGVIVLDLNLPYLDGFEFLTHYAQEIAARHPQTQIYILSSSVREQDRLQSLAYPFVRDFISKPLKIERLKDMLMAVQTS
ncbi:MAG: response regulator [Candidatus Sericytochromatia bacterium]